MKKISAHSKTSLFLMEMILVLLFLALSSAACIRIFAAAKNNHIQAQEWRHIQTLTTSVGEILEDSEGTAKNFVSLFPVGLILVFLFFWFYDSCWELEADSQASYKMELTLHETANPRQGTLTFYHATNDIQIYTIDLVFPIIENSDKEASS